MSLTVTYLGAQSMGASNQNPAADVAYTVPVTAASAGWLTGVESAWTAGNLKLQAGLYADNAGVPGELIALSGLTSTNYNVTGDARWIVCPLFVWLPAADYHIGVSMANGINGPQLKVTTGGASGDGHTIDSGVSGPIPDGDYSSSVVSATTSTYSVRGVFVAESSGPTPPPSGGGNRMGGDRAIRRSPVGR